jgi:hypothetical protein
MSTLQTYVYKLRRQLFEHPDDGDERLMIKPSGYLPRMSPSRNRCSEPV